MVSRDMKVPAIHTKQVLLRPLRKGDADNPNIARFMQRMPYPYARKHAEDFIEQSLREYRKKKPWEINFAIEHDGEVIGVISIREIEHGHRAELAYWIGEPFWGKGIMTEAVKKVAAFGFKEFDLHRIRAGAVKQNKGSQRVLEKAGFTQEGLQRKNIKKGNTFLDSYLYAKIR